MRKFLFVFIALFVTGEVCKAQNLLPGNRLKVEKTVKVNIPEKSTKDADSGSKEYWVSATSYYDEYNQFITDDNYRDCQYTAKLKFDGDSATIEGLIDLSRFDYTTPELTPIHGLYNATEHTLTIQTPAYESGKDISSYTKVGSMFYYGDEVTMVLFSGKWIKMSDGQAELEPSSEIVFDVSDDLSTITARSAFGCYAFVTSSGDKVGFVDFYHSSVLSKLTNEPKLSVTPDSINFKGASVTVGATLTAPVYLSNMSLTDVDYNVKISGEGLKLETSDNIGAKETQAYKVVYNPQRAGEFNGSITFEAANGSTATTQIKAYVGEAPDFSKIVREGDFSFFNGEDNPFVITDTITGSPVAVSTSQAGSNSSTLNIGFNVPEGKTGIISWKGVSKAQTPNGVIISLDEDEIRNNTYDFNGFVKDDDISDMLVVGSGQHVLSFVNKITVDWQQDIKTYISDLSLKIKDIESDEAIVKNENIDFGRHYYDNLSVNDTAIVKLLNSGLHDLSLLSSTNTKNFTAVIDGEKAAYGKELPIKVVFTGNAIGTYEGKITLHTTAGDFTVNCKASAEKIIYDYSPIVSEGNFSFNTSFDYPFIVDNNTAKSNISGLDPYGKDLTAWLEASFEVPEGQEGELSWKANNSSLDFLVFLGDTILENGSYITIDGQIRKEFAGESINCSSEVFGNNVLVFKPGVHNIRFSYTRTSSDIVGLDRLVVSNLALHLQVSGVNGISTNREVARKEIYSIDGKRLELPDAGLNIVRYVYTDGTTKTTKEIIK